MAYLTARIAAGSRNRTQIYLVKALILADLFALQHDGRPIIGGPLVAWPLGPVNNHIYDQLSAYIEAARAGMNLPAGFQLSPNDHNQSCEFSGYGFVDDEDLSPLERSALEWAWQEIGHLSFSDLKHYTHSPTTFMGAAWTEVIGETWTGNRRMDWLRLLWQFDQFRGTNHFSRMKDQILTSSVRIPFETPDDAPINW